ncbi:hypothetical protein [Dactylosporangium matsuzakiense]|uniref:Uncharacterized protein n=1 Tax=Dactylosporangium matsuzakiense TaxID=53360 RepID=A0A9W6NIX1_9ACTN|nr:hypothetical protein [Dactylosporangium matsuzakiense]UWZ45381.1 hypothetical protein Dmats_02190 [Dactylosporangium matsuzakiense]GLK98633.1 hypothetical protein GCM10017581_003740 [Dactylosporangium matsuzakiense]
MESTFEAVRAEALFASQLQMSQGPVDADVRAAVTHTLRRIGVQGCVARVATEFGEHPECASNRMNWALRMIRHAYAASCTPEVFVQPKALAQPAR